jgi:hypothetical protein
LRPYPQRLYVFGTLSTPASASRLVQSLSGGARGRSPSNRTASLPPGSLGLSSAQHALRPGAHYASHNASRPRPTPAETPPGSTATPAHRLQPTGLRRPGAMRRGERRVAGGSGSESPLLKGRRSTESEVYDDGTNTFFW